MESILRTISAEFLCNFEIYLAFDELHFDSFFIALMFFKSDSSTSHRIFLSILVNASVDNRSKSFLRNQVLDSGFRPKINEL